MGDPIEFPEWEPIIEEGPLETHLSHAEFKNTLILDRIFILLAEMIGTLQSVAAAQAARLNKLTSWQKAYTDILVQIKTYLAGQNIQQTKFDVMGGAPITFTVPNPFGGNILVEFTSGPIQNLPVGATALFLPDKIGVENIDPLSQGEAQDRNNLNSQWTEAIRARRQVISDEAKVLQSNISKSVDAVSEQANMATAIIQQLSTLLSTIYR